MRRATALAAAAIGIAVPVAVAAWITLRNGRTLVGPTWPAARVNSSAAPREAAVTLPTVPDGDAEGPQTPQPARPDAEFHNGLFAALGRAVYRARRWLPIVGVAAVIGLNAWAGVAGGSLSQGGWQVPGSEALAAEQILSDRFGDQPSNLIVILTDPDGDAASAEFQATIADAVAPLADEPIVDEILTYADVGDASFVSRDGDRTFALVALTEDMETATDDAEHLASLVTAPEGVEVTVTGVPLLQHEFNMAVEEDLVRAELISLPIALVILLAVFGTLVGAALPLVIAGMALPSGLAVITLLAGVTEMSIFVTNVATMIGLALAIDYALFMVSRFREELRAHTVADAVERTMATVGKAVAISGVAVAIGLSSLTVFQSPALRSMGIGGVVTVLSTMVFGLTVLPALLGMLGPRVNRLRIPVPGPMRLVSDDSAAPDAGQARGMWARIAGVVMRRPILVATPVLILLLAAGLPFLNIQLSTGGNLDDLPPTPAVAGFRVLENEFPGGDTDPVEVAVRYPDAIGTDGALSETWLRDLQAYVTDLRALDAVTEVSSVLEPAPGLDEATYRSLVMIPEAQRPPDAAGVGEYLDRWIARDVTRLDVFSTALPDSADGRALVNAIRTTEAPGAVETLTAGLSSRSRDFLAAFDASVPWAVAIVVAVTAAVLFLTFGSVFLPVKAVLMSLLSITASFGALVWIFQEGHLKTILGFEPSGTLVASTPVLMFAVLFGLSMDYEVFLLSRIRERYLATGDTTRAVAEGIGITGGIITGAALIMVAVFGAFAMSSVVLIKALGFSMALAVLVDATIVRGILVPAFMRVMGSVNWWAPGWLQRAVARLGLYERGVPATA